MPLYSYLARDKKGQAVRGKITVKSESELIQYLERSSLLPIKYELLSEGSAGRSSKLLKFLRLEKKVKRKDLIVFTRQFATTIKAGIPIVNALRFLSQEAQEKTLRDVLSQIVTKVEQGASLSQAFREYPGVFSVLYVEMVASGEISGTLDQVLLNLAETMERDYRIYLEVKNALRYPVIVLTAVTFAIIFITIFVVPRFAGVYRQFDMPLPLPTRILIGSSNFILHNLGLLVFLFALGIFLFARWKKTPKGSILWGKVKLKIPIMGDIFMKLSLLRFCFIFNALNSVGIPILKSLEVVSRTLGNEFLRLRAEKFIQKVSEGKSLSSSIAQDKYFPKLLANMIGVGEQAGTMDVVLSSLSEYYQVEVRSKLEGLTVTLEPLLTGLLGLCVFVLALGVFLPMWNMTQLFRPGR